MSSTNDSFEKIRDEKVGNTGKKVLLVEGKDDADAYSELLNRKFFKCSTKWEEKWIVTHAEGKQKVIDILKASNEPTWLGLIDRDEWSAEQIEQEQDTLPNLLVLPRFCLENYLICPDELWEALSKNQQAKLTEGFPQFKAKILIDKDQWVRHGVLWSIIKPLWDGIINLGFQKALLDFNNAQDNDKIQEKLNEWHEFINPKDIFKDFETRLKKVMEKDEAEQLKRWVHGKQFYRQHVTQVLNRFLGGKQENPEARRRQILKTCPLPNDLDFLYQRMGLL
ncbi:MAG TPA: DUF4435 domain-containing protein [Thiotrichaceae bacterium]|jgi:hypothetical protein|nr:DUF4435 domain-containing protein [Thiotrichaceae bacterium]